MSQRVCLLAASRSGSSGSSGASGCSLTKECELVVGGIAMDTSHPASPPPSGKDISQHSSTVHPPPPAAFPPAAHFRTGYNVGGKDPGASNSTGYCTKILTVFSILVIGATFPFSLCLCIKIVQEYERAVIFRLGRLLQGGAKGPGLFFIIPCIDTYSKVDLRTVSFDVPPQEILSKDSVTVAVDAVVYYRISNATIAITNVEDYGHSTRLLAATTLRNVLGTKNLSEILSERESISHVMQSSLDEATDSWGVKVERVEIKDVRLPVQLQRAMAAEAEATREARAKVIAAEGEQRASRSLKEAAEVIAETPSALQLRYLQTLTSIAAEKNSTIVFPLPMEIMRSIIYSHQHSNNTHYQGNSQHNGGSSAGTHEKNSRNMRTQQHHTDKDLGRGETLAVIQDQRLEETMSPPSRSHRCRMKRS
ncbi:band 7 protein AGAP004871-like isoform X2 [Varroa jacobsoni]|uniref:band 7 protein AGAP004871-like isoform X2 n=1 Tax=Varroa jacobsoni TaxID=62625 RepID=UPI000BF2AF4A|nr:band 7 protein AGAP004871-like isoform X2 [Varroa jacobsoni]